MCTSASHGRIDESEVRSTCEPISISQKATTMKRPSSPSSVPSKKLKTSPRVSDSEEISPEGVPADSQWVKVEKRKSKKQRKRNAKLDVCVSISSLAVIHNHTLHRRLHRRLILLDFCILMLRSPSAETLLASTYCLLTSISVCAYHCNQDVRDLVLHIIADAPPPSWIRVQVSLLCLRSRL
jgi:hypothetical protein